MYKKTSYKVIPSDTTINSFEDMLKYQHILLIIGNLDLKFACGVSTNPYICNCKNLSFLHNTGIVDLKKCVYSISIHL